MPVLLRCHLRWWLQTVLQSHWVHRRGFSPAERITLAILDQIRDATQAHGMKFVLIMISRRMRDKPSDTETFLLQWAEKTGTPVVNLRENYLAMPAAERHELFAGHWTPYGASVTAELLANKIQGIL